MLRLMLVVGTRPQIIKSAPILHQAEKHSSIELQLVHTGQHYDYELSKIFFNENNLPTPLVNLEVGSGSHAYQTAQIMTRLEPILLENDPDTVLVPGDTNSALAAALTSAKLCLRSAHVEAGARSYNMSMAEEINRRMIDHISSSLFAVSENCRKNLEQEKVLGDVLMTGDTMYEAYLQHLPRAKRSKILDKLDLDDKEYDILTVHRAENVDDRDIFLGMMEAVSNSDLKIVFPVHPRTRSKMKELGIESHTSSLIPIEPVGYHEMLRLLSSARLAITDSGGLQKEAFWSGVPCITLRNETEWGETTELGVNFLAGSQKGRIIETIKHVIDDYDDLLIKFRNISNPYGDGKASVRILHMLENQEEARNKA